MKKTKSGDFGDLSEGNTKPRSNQLVKLAFTWNNYDKSKFNLLETTFKSFGRKAIIQSEVGLECKTPHLHGGIWFKINPKTNKPFTHRWQELNLPETIHWEKMIDDNAWIDYCSKTGPDGFDGVYRFSFGMPKPLKIITNLQEWQKDAEKLLLGEPDGRTIHWWYDTIGGKGKSVFCKYMVATHNCLCIQGGKLADIMNIIFNTDMDTVNSVIIDVPRHNTNKVSYSAIECILNGMITNTKFETGRKMFNPPNIMVFSNFYPDTNNLSEDRWNIKDLNEGLEVCDN